MGIKPKFLQESQSVIDLTGPDGNAFVLLATAKSTARQLDYNKDEVDALLKDMQSGDYTHLVMTFDKHFGDFYTLYTNDEDILKAFGTPYELECNKPENQ